MYQGEESDSGRKSPKSLVDKLFVMNTYDLDTRLVN